MKELKAGSTHCPYRKSHEFCNLGGKYCFEKNADRSRIDEIVALCLLGVKGKTFSEFEKIGHRADSDTMKDGPPEKY